MREAGSGGDIRCPWCWVCGDDGGSGRLAAAAVSATASASAMVGGATPAVLGVELEVGVRVGRGCVGGVI